MGSKHHGLLRSARIVRWVPVMVGFVHDGQPALAGLSPPALDQPGGYASTQIVVRVKPDQPQLLSQPSSEVQTLNQRWRVTHIRPAFSPTFRQPRLAQELGLDRTHVLYVPKGTDALAMAMEYEGLEGVEVAEVDGIGGAAGAPIGFPDDPDFAWQWNMHNDDVDADIDAPEAWSLHTGVSSPVLVGVVDGGIDPHVEFADRLVGGINTNDPSHPEWTSAGSGCPHGNHIAGIIAARGNDGTGIAGVNWGALLMPVRVLDSSCLGTELQCALGIVWAADHGAVIINVSLQYYQGTEVLRGAVDYATAQGALVVAAAGNNQGANVAYPARFDHSLAVSATTALDQFAAFSNFGPQIDLAAPGENILSTLTPNGYASWSGAAMAAAHVSGVASLLNSFDANLSGDEIRGALEASADDLGAVGRDDQFGWGRVNGHRALCAVARPEAEAACADFVDNDCDGWVDCADPGCESNWPCCTSDSDCEDGDSCTCDQCLGSPGSCANIPNEAGDVDCSGVLDVDDLLCVLAGFSNLDSCRHGDVEPCEGDGDIDVDDIQAMLNAFQGFDACGC